LHATETMSHVDNNFSLLLMVQLYRIVSYTITVLLPYTA